MRVFVLILITTVNLYGARFLFDYTKNETAGNADWIVDSDYPYPQPSNPIDETDWDRALSSWAYRLYLRGHEIVTLPPTGSITYGDPTNEFDLSNFDVFVMVEPQNPLSSTEINAILSFIQNGGGFFMVADHNASDRDNDGWDSPNIFNDAFESYFGIHFHVTGDANNSVSAVSTNILQNPQDSILHGPSGDVDTLGYWAGTVITIKPSVNSTLKGTVWYPGVPQDTTNIMFFYGRYGNGKIAGLGDSSPCDDGTGAPGDNLYDNWHMYDDSTIILNASLWLASSSGGSQNTSPYITRLSQIPEYPSDTDSVEIKALITDSDGTVSTDSLYYRVDGGTYISIFHTKRVSDTSYYIIPPQAIGSVVDYYIFAQDDSGATSTSQTFSYTVSSSSSNGGTIVINEIMYNPCTAQGDDSLFEYIELYNTSASNSVDMSNWTLSDNAGTIHFPTGFIVPPHYYVIVARDTLRIKNWPDYQGYWDGDEIFVQSDDTIQLSNSGDLVVLKSPAKGTIDSVSYDDSSPWPTQPDGNGPSLELKNPDYDNILPESWEASDPSVAPYGTPGESNSASLSIKENSVFPEKEVSRKVLILSVRDIERIGKEGFEIFGPDGRKANTILKNGLYFLVNKKERKILRIMIVK